MHDDLLIDVADVGLAPEQLHCRAASVLFTKHRMTMMNGHNLLRRSPFPHLLNRSCQINTTTLRSVNSTDAALRLMSGMSVIESCVKIACISQ